MTGTLIAVIGGLAVGSLIEGVRRKRMTLPGVAILVFAAAIGGGIFGHMIA